MFAPMVAKPQRKTAAGSNHTLAHQRSTLLGHRSGRGLVERMGALQRSIGNQAMLQLLAQRAASLTECKPHVRNESRETPGAIAPDRGDRPQAPVQLIAPVRPGAILRKLVIGQVNDPLEYEADLVADQVMRMPTAGLSVAPSPPQLSRACAACEEELQRDAVSAADLDGQEVPPVVHQVLAEPGRPLDPDSRAFFEPRLGLDLGHVRLHDDAQAARSARAVGARAFTVGGHIAFADAVDGASESGRRLLAHELVHVVQQTGSAAQRLARDDAPYTPSGASGALANAADTIAEYRGRAATALIGSGLAAADAARIGRNLATCASGEQRLRAVAQTGDDAASASVLAAFTLDGMRQVIPRLTAVQPARKAVAVNEADDGELAAVPASISGPSRPVEREAERVAAELVPSDPLARDVDGDRVLRRYLSPEDVRQIEQAAAPAAPAIAAATLTAAAIATAPLWVWVVVAVVVVAVAAAALYWIYSDDDSGTVAQAAPQPKPDAVTKPEMKDKPSPYDRPLAGRRPGEPKRDSPC
jgi:hypothetical protein